MEYFAKGKGYETIEEHTKLALKGLNEIFELYGERFSDREKELYTLAVTYHDCGKTLYLFQKKMYSLLKKELKLEDEAEKEELEKLYEDRNEKQFPHGYLSPAFINLSELEEKLSEEEIKAVINAIVYHHTRKEKYNKETALKYLKYDLRKRLKCPLKIGYSEWVEAEEARIEDKDWVLFAAVKGLLNKADYWASSHVDTNIEISPYKDGGDVGTIVEKELIKKYGTIREVQSYMKAHQEDNIIVIAPTGSGKTEGALMWIQGSKAFYTLPLRVSINAIYERIKSEYNYPEDKFTLLHTDSISYLLEHEEEEQEEDRREKDNKKKALEPFRKNQLAKDFSFPLTICTIDQIFRFIYKYRGSELLLAVLKYSKLVVDEIQAYSPEIIGKLIYGLKLISMAGGKVAIMTATLPPIVFHFIKKEKIPFQEPVTIPAYIDGRHKITYKEGDFDYEEIIEKSINHKVLIICNTVKKAQEVYERLGEEIEVFLLHSRFMQKDKAKLEEEIMKFSKDVSKKGVWIATQIVEASLDIDFDFLYTEMCTADSLLQRMGRCFRKRIYKEKEPNVKIFLTGNGVSESGKKGIYDKFLYDRSVFYLSPYNGKIFTEAEKQDYINAVYAVEKEIQNSIYYNSIRDTINACKAYYPGFWSREEAAKAFREIESTQIIPKSVYDELVATGKWDEWVNDLKGEDKVKSQKARIKIQKYVVSVSYFIKDKFMILDSMNIYRSSLRYEFDEETKKGRGLLKEAEEEKFYFD